MSDITKCDTQYCPSANRCWRKIAPSNALSQSYAHFTLPPDRESCDDFIPVDILFNANPSKTHNHESQSFI